MTVADGHAAGSKVYRHIFNLNAKAMRAGKEHEGACSGPAPPSDFPANKLYPQPLPPTLQ